VTTPPNNKKLEKYKPKVEKIIEEVPINPK